jgi:hypothetical protein
LFVIAPASYLAFLLLSQVPRFAEATYGNAMAPFFSSVLSTITGVLPFALGELLVILVLLWYMIEGAVALRDVILRRRDIKNALAVGALRFARDAGVLVGLFYILWGFNYALPPLPQRLGWHALGEVGAEELSELVVETTVATNAAYLALHGTTDIGTPTSLPDDLESLENSLQTGWERAREELGLPSFPDRFGGVKTPLFTKIYEWLGIAGYYFPFTAEGNVRAGIPAIDYPKILAHEMTHQRGVARESEANFWGYLASVYSDDELAKYSAYRFANRQMVAELARVDPQTALMMSRRRLPGVQRDIEHSRRYWQMTRGSGTVIGSTVNNAFLRSNRVEGGVRSYSMSVFLFLAYARAHGGNLVPGSQGGEAPSG